MYSNGRSKALQRVLKMLETETGETGTQPITFDPQIIRILMADLRQAPAKKEEDKKPISSEVIALAEAFSKLGDCMRDLTDTLRILPENLVHCVEEVIKNRSNVSKGNIDVWKDPRTGRSVYILNVQKDSNTLKETEGLLEEIGKKIEREGIDTPDLVRKAWKKR